MSHEWPHSNRLSPRAKFLLRHTPPADPKLVAEVRFTCKGLHVIGISMGSARPAEYGQQHVFVSQSFISVILQTLTCLSASPNNANSGNMCFEHSALKRYVYSVKKMRRSSQKIWNHGRRPDHPPLLVKLRLSYIVKNLMMRMWVALFTLTILIWPGTPVRKFWAAVFCAASGWWTVLFHQLQMSTGCCISLAAWSLLGLWSIRVVHLWLYWGYLWYSWHSYPRIINQHVDIQAPRYRFTWVLGSGRFDASQSTNRTICCHKFVFVPG